MTSETLKNLLVDLALIFLMISLELLQGVFFAISRMSKFYPFEIELISSSSERY